VILLSNYTDGNFSISLVSIQNPAAKTIVKTEDKVAKEILDALTPKAKCLYRKWNL